MIGIPGANVNQKIKRVSPIISIERTCNKVSNDDSAQQYKCPDLPQQSKEQKNYSEYTALADRTRRHEAELSATPQHVLLAKHLQTVGYITSWEEKVSPLEKETSRKVLKLRIKQVK